MSSNSSFRALERQPPPYLAPQQEPSRLQCCDELTTTNNSLSLAPSPNSTLTSKPGDTPYANGPDVEAKALVNPPHNRLYKRRWFGLAELTLLSFAIGWGHAAPAVVAKTAIEWYGIGFSNLNYLGIANSAVFIIPAPFVIWILNRYGPKFSILVACVLFVIGNWIIFAGAATHNFSVHIVGTIIHALGTPFILASPTRYSRQWFDDQGRTLATALPSLAYPLGSAVGALSGPYMIKPLGPLTYDIQALVIAALFTAAAIPTPFLPKAPPLPPSFTAAVKRLSTKEALRSLATNPTFYLQFISFSVFASAVDTLTSLTTQAITAYGFPQVDAGYALSFLLFSGIVAALILSPILDRTKAHRITLKVIVIFIAACYTTLPFIPQTHSTAGLYAIYALVGIGTLSVEPCVLEFQAAWTHPVSPEFSSVICWSGAKALGAILTWGVGNELPLKKPAEGQPPRSLFNGLILIAVLCWVCVPCALLNGYGIFKRPELSEVEGND